MHWQLSRLYLDTPPTKKEDKTKAFNHIIANLFNKIVNLVFASGHLLTAAFVSHLSLHFLMESNCLINQIAALKRQHNLF